MGQSCTKCWYRNTSCVEHALMKLFRKWGLFVANHPLLTIIISLSLAGALSFFMLFIENEDDLEQLYAPKGTPSWNNYIKYKETWDLYEDTIAINNAIIYDKTHPSKNILSIEYLTIFQNLYNDINSIQIEYNNTNYTYQDICYKYENGNCGTRSVLELYQFNQDIIESTFNQTIITYPAQYSSYSDKQLFIPLILGQNISTQFIPDYNIEIVTSSPAFQMTFMLDLGYYGEDLCNQWYLQFLDTMDKWADDPEINLGVSYEGYNSFNDELTRAVASDVTSFVIGFMLLSSFSTLMILRFKRSSKSFCNRSMYKLDMKRCRGRIGWVGTISSMLAVSSSFGLVGGIFGIKFNTIVSVAPFLLVGLGCM